MVGWGMRHWVIVCGGGWWQRGVTGAKSRVCVHDDVIGTPLIIVKESQISGGYFLEGGGVNAVQFFSDFWRDVVGGGRRHRWFGMGQAIACDTGAERSKDVVDVEKGKVADPVVHFMLIVSLSLAVEVVCGEFITVLRPQIEGRLYLAASKECDEKLAKGPCRRL